MIFFRKLLISLLGDNFYRELTFLVKYYHFSFFKKKPLPVQIYCLDGRTYNCGFADRLRGIISVYAYSKANDYAFMIKHEIPFRIEEFFSCNKVDWSFKENEISYNALFVSPVVLVDHANEKRLCRLKRCRQRHFYSNINFLSAINQYYGKNYIFSDLFQELFKPSEQLLMSIAPYQKYLDEGYISISFRFMQLMGDFVDVCGNTLSLDEQERLTLKCIDFIDAIFKKHRNIKSVLVTTDSEKFLSRVKSLDYVFTIPGKIGHIGFRSGSDIHLKTMMDFYMISQARKAYMGYTGQMYKSHFAESAAETTGIPYEGIEF